MGCVEIALVGAVVAVALFLVALPVKMAAAALGARRTGLGWALLALVVASILHSVGLTVPVAGTVVAFLLSAAGFAAILGTGFLRGIGIAVLHAVFGALLLLLLAVLFGISVGGLAMI